ncbi:MULTISPECIES: nickel ABC transporter permease [unclassified Paenibacillus]|uniref:nickel ABC transporter permease n=1 Tax=unclassified Paenibacillus TaxID=185978 RepID=UPI0009A57B60|nr:MULTISPECIES: nickel ABC transporter permease [unclassified Paenibacillus]SLK21013.1 peptide/nickel transport system permease protein [Paenibacillus sp. RU5A]SOC76423.1 peptide/nickel transport system permease protein [Paenibacillus sp. RU26A]SOC77907.1 peptide/nickel transport system permease protein [Paenibacillus sp. RU5M]
MNKLLKRSIEFILFILLLSFISFVFVKMAPGDAVREMLRSDDVAITSSQIEEQREALGLNDPVLVQYGQWLGRLVRLDLGTSYMTNRPVTEELLDKLPATLLLTCTSLLVLIVIAIPLGTLSALYPNRVIDRFSRLLAVLGTSVPSFWLGLLLIEGFSVRTHLFPSMGTGSIAHLVLPSLTLGLTMAAVYVRLIRSSLLESLGQDFVRGARSRGIGGPSVLLRHAFRHALTPVVTMFGVSIGSLLGGTVVIEVLFSYPGMGKFIVDAIQSRDYPVIQGYMVLMGLIVTIMHMLVDLLNDVLNPEIRLKGER